MASLIFFRIFAAFIFIGSTALTETVDSDKRIFKIEGRVKVSTSKKEDWIANTRVMIDGGEYVAYLRGDGSFVVHGLSSGSYVVEVENQKYLFEPARVDISSRGKVRARKVNNVKPSAVEKLPYPLEFRTKGKADYFQKREQLKITDLLRDPMVLTTMFALVMIMFLPKMGTADPEALKRMQSQMQVFNNKSSSWDLSEILTRLFGGGSSSKTSSNKKRK